MLLTPPPSPPLCCQAEAVAKVEAEGKSNKLKKEELEAAVKKCADSFIPSVAVLHRVPTHVLSLQPDDLHFLEVR